MKKCCYVWGRIPFAKPLASSLFSNAACFAGFLRLVALVDKRPGRLYSFICDKQKA
jgi:hypothetical protein